MRQTMNWVALALLILAVGSVSAQQSAGILLQSGLYQEDVNGDLEAAIKIYEQVMRDFPRDRPVAAKALLHIALCKEKLGQQEALSAYRKVVDQYPEQQAVVSAAKEKISELSAIADKRAKGPAFQKVHMPLKVPWDAQLSPDGKRVLFVNQRQLWVAPRSSSLGASYPGTPTLIDAAGVEADWNGLAWSADGQWIAFNRDALEEGRSAIYVIRADGGTPRKVHENNRDFRLVNYRMSLSPHGEAIAFSSVDERELHIYTLRLDGGSPKRLVDAPAREPVFSPDGMTIAFVEDKDLGRRGGGLWVVPAEGGTPRQVAEAKNASTPVWSPDGSRLAFVDDAANSQIRVVPLAHKEGTGREGITIDCRREGLENVARLTGWTPENELGAVCGKKTDFALYTMPLQGGKPAFVAHGGYPVQPRWSPDGKRIFHVNSVNETSGDWEQLALAYVSAEGGPVTMVPLKSQLKIRLSAYGTGNRVSPDGTTIVFAGQKQQESKYTFHLWLLPVQGGKPRQLTDEPGSVTDWFPYWSPNGQQIAFVRVEDSGYADSTWKPNIFVIPAEGGNARQVTSAADRVFSTGPVIWSPDGALLAFFSRDKDDDPDGTIKVIPATGGTHRVVAKNVKAIYANKEMAWSPDSRRIAYNSPEDKVSIVSLEDGMIEEINPSLEGVAIYHLDWSPDGKRLVFPGASGGGSEFWMVGDFLPKLSSAK